MPLEVKRGEIYWVDWSSGRGSEQGGIRPSLVIQNDLGNKLSPTTIVAACTTADVRPYPFIVPIARQESGLPQDCLVNLSAILTIDKSRLRGKAGQLGEDKMAEVDSAIKISLGL
jgi:mRNA interferase MazF